MEESDKNLLRGYNDFLDNKANEILKVLIGVSLCDAHAIIRKVEQKFNGRAVITDSCKNKL